MRKVWEEKVVRLTVVGFLVAVVVSSTACAAAPAAAPSADPPRGESMQQVVAANTEFGFNLLAQLHEQDPRRNIFISPLSVSIALTMTYNGAAGMTAQAMAEALVLNELDLEEVNRSYAALLRRLEELNPRVIVTVANSLWARQDVEFREDFLERNRVHFGAEVNTLEFGAPDAKDIINDWVDKTTRGKIDEIVDTIDPLHVMFLISAIYFNGEWHDRFDKKKTRDRVFHLADGSEKLHPMMSRTGNVAHRRGEDFQAVKLTYKDESVAMYVFLPGRESDLETFLGELNTSNWELWMSEFNLRKVNVVFPRFRIEYEAALKEPLVALGMGLAFDHSAADFSSTSPSQLYIDEVEHKAIVEVDERGTEAAAATRVGVRAQSAPPSFVANRPFFFVIRDDVTGTILFMGLVYEPEE